MWRVLVASLTVLLLAPGSAFAAGEKGTPRPAPVGRKPLQVKAGTLKGVVKSYSGRPFARVTLELVDAKGHVVARTVTNQRGEYLLRNVPPGRYTAVVGGKVKLPLTMTAKATVSRLIIVPHFVPEKRRPAGAPFWAGFSTWTWVAIGGGAAVAIATPIIIVASRRHRHRAPISP